MSGIIHGAVRIFKATVIRPITHPLDIVGNTKNALHVMKQETVKAWHNKIVRYVAIAVAAYFTAGAALGYFGAAAGAGGGAAAGTAAGAAGGAAAGAGAASTVGIMAGSTAASTAAAGFSGLATFGAADTAAIGYGALAADAATVGGGLAAGAGMAAGSSAAGGSLAAFSGQAVGANALAAGADASTISQSTALASMPAGSSNAALSSASQAASNPASFDFTAASGGSYSGGTAGSSGALTDSSGLTSMGGAPSSLASEAAGGNSSFTGLGGQVGASDAASGAAPTSIWGRVEDGAHNLWTKMFGPGTTTTTPGAIAGTSVKGSLLGEMGKAALIQGGLQMASSLLQKPQVQQQFSGVNSKGQGAGLGIHTINGGFGLATGGSEPAPGGVPDALKPPSGSDLSNAAVSNKQPASGNLAQTVANSAGIGGLVPQGAVDYMGGSGNGS